MGRRGRARAAAPPHRRGGRLSVAYILLAYKLPQQLGRLVRAVEPEHSPVFVHVDGRTDARTHAAMHQALEGLPNVAWLPRHRVRWGGFGIVASALDGIARVVEDGVPADHLVLMTAQDYPVKPAGEIRSFLAGFPGESYLAWAPVPPAGAAHGGLDRRRLERWWFHLAGRHRSLPARRRVPGGLEPYGGHGHWCLARNAVEEVHRTVRARPDLVRFFRHVAAPDELLFQTILLNSEIASTIRNDPLRFIDFPPGRPSPRVLTSADLPTLAALPANGLWARKFDETVDAAVLDGIDALIAP